MGSTVGEEQRTTVLCVDGPSSCIYIGTDLAFSLMLGWLLTPPCCLRVR